MRSEDIRNRFLKFFEERGHKIIPSASLVPEDDPSALFTSAGMQPLVPYLLGEEHPEGNRLANVQKCVRTTDIDEVGDKTHLTFFEMLGNWSLGDYFKEEAIKWSYELLTSKEEGFGLDPERLYITCFEGDEKAPKDEESARIWQEVGIPEERIYFMPSEDNWWSVGDDGPAGPDTEMFYDLSPEGLGEMTKEEFTKASEEEKVVEIWNDVFMEYKMKEGRVAGKLPQQNVDTGAGFERVTTVLQGKASVYETDLFEPLMKKIREFSEGTNLKMERIVADHVRASVFIIGDGVEPGNTDRGYILRRLLRRAVRNADQIKMKDGGLLALSEEVISKYSKAYPKLGEKKNFILETVSAEEDKFRETLRRGLKQFEKLGKDISGEEAFDLYQSYGFPIELTVEMAEERGGEVDVEGYEKALKEHQEISKSGAEKKFKGGLAGHSDKEIQYHTATHLLNAALREVLGEHVEQKGSNITPDRLRFDFSHPEKMTDEEVKKVEDWVNRRIEEDLPVSSEIMNKEEAEASGAIGVFDEKYGDKVKVYFIGEKESICSAEFCGGPHVERTGELEGTFRIKKETSSSAGVRRIKAVLE